MNALGLGWQLTESQQLLYSDTVGKDACGIGAVASKHGVPSHEVLHRSILALVAMEHRGGVCGNAGDGAGVTLALPQPFFKDEAKKLHLDGARDLRPEHTIGVGSFFFLDSDAGKIQQAKKLIYDCLHRSPCKVLGFRPVPTNQDALPQLARDSQPTAYEHLLFTVTGDVAQAERWLYRRRLELQVQLTELGFHVYIPSISVRLVSYKGLLTSSQLRDFYPDLTNPALETGIAIFHRRYSTNTLPNWKLAQPFRFTAHNGEINTIRTNRNAVAAYIRGLSGDKALPNGELLTKKMSDSGSLDEWLEFLTLEQGWSLERAVRLSIPPVWDTEEDVWGPEAFQLFTYMRRTYGSLCAWDGPAGIVATDGRTLLGVVDRMGLRPMRWCSDRRGWLYIGSESGVFGLDNANIVASGQLQPGQMIALDTTSGERADSHQIMKRVVAEAEKELGDIHALNLKQIVQTEGFDINRQTDDVVGDALREQNWSVDHLLQAAGWDFERAVFVKDMAKLKKEPLSSMGHDRVLTVFSAHHPTLFKYCQQTFAEVTNPPIDPYREGGAMSLMTYLGRSPLSHGNPLPATGEDELPVKQMELPSPIVNDAMMDELQLNDLYAYEVLDATYMLQGGAVSLKTNLDKLRADAERFVHEGHHVLCISDREACKPGTDPIPSLLALGAVHTHLCKQGLRDRCSLIVQAGDIQEGHDIAVLVGFGADAVHPYLMLRLIKEGITWKHIETKQDVTLSPRDALEGLFDALEDSLKKIISKMGITTIEGYRGAMLFEAVGFGPELMEFLGDFPSRIGGLTLQDLVDDCTWRVKQAENMKVLGRNRDYHAYNAKVRMALREAVLAAHAETNVTNNGGEMAYTAPPIVLDDKIPGMVELGFAKFSKMVAERPPTVLRDLFTIVKPGNPINKDTVTPAKDLVKNHFRGAAMSHGALSGNSHMTIAAALNELGGCSNSGEGGEFRWRNDVPLKHYIPFWDQVLAKRTAEKSVYALDGDIMKSRFRSKIRQVASGRFGVDAEYLINADELQIKMAQGAKPGEGGQLMGKKVTKEIAEIRFAKQGTDLISPPPHHDIYSIEDLAQLIYDLKAAKPGVKVSVKLVSVENIGTIACGVAKAGADVIEIDGIDGGTGAAMVSSKEHAGLPSEMGLAEAHQALVVNGLRHSVKLRVGGGIKTGADVIKYALFGAEEFVFGQGLMVSVGCIVCKSCHIPNCPTGITSDQKEYNGHPEHTKAYLMVVAEEVRCILAELGYTDISQITGRSELLVKRTDSGLSPRVARVDVSRFLRADMALHDLNSRFPQQKFDEFGVCNFLAGVGTLNHRMLEATKDAIEAPADASLLFKIRNSDRSVGATMAGHIAKLYGREGLPGDRRIKILFDGEAGQSFGAWCVAGLDLELRGMAQDGVAKGISGGTVCVTLDYEKTDYGKEILSVAGNNVGFGATGGTVFIGGRAGHRLGIRNSGATIVAEAAGKYACEYMTRGRVLILGPIENQIGSGMTGGELFVYDPNGEVPSKLHSGSVTVCDIPHVDYEWLHRIVDEFKARTGSRLAAEVSRKFSDIRRSRRIRKVIPLNVASAKENFKVAGTSAG